MFIGLLIHRNIFICLMLFLLSLVYNRIEMVSLKCFVIEMPPDVMGVAGPEDEICTSQLSNLKSVSVFLLF